MDPTSSPEAAEPSPETVEPVGSPADADQLAEAAGAVADAEPGSSEPTPESPDPTEDLGTPFRLEDVPEEIREHVGRYVKQTHAALTRKTQELAQQRQEVSGLASLKDRLDSDETRVDALKEFLAGYDIDLDFEDEEQVEAAAEAVSEEVSDDLASRVARIEAAAQEVRESEQREADEDAQEQYVEQVRSSMETGFSAFAERQGWKDTGGNPSVPQAVREQITAIVRSMPPIVEDGVELPDMAAAIAVYEGWEASAIERYAQSKRAPTVDASGSSGVQKLDMTKPEDRDKAALAVAGRHLG
jgi:hypothetical protein